MIATAAGRSSATWSAGARPPVASCATVAGAHQDRGRADGSTEAHVARVVADHEASLESNPNRSAAASAMPGAGLRHAQPSSGRWGQTLDPSTRRARRPPGASAGARGSCSSSALEGKQPAPDLGLVRDDDDRRAESSRRRSNRRGAPGISASARGREVVSRSTLIVPSRSSSANRRVTRGRPGLAAARRPHAVGVKANGANWPPQRSQRRADARCRSGGRPISR